MNLKDVLKDDMKSSRIEKNKDLIKLLSFVLGESDRIGKNPTNEQIEKIIRKAHDNLVNEIGTVQSIAEAKLLDKYLPTLMPEDEIKKEVNIIISDINAESMKDMGRVIGEFTKLFKGKADMKIVSGLVREKLK